MTRPDGKVQLRIEIPGISEEASDLETALKFLGEINAPVTIQI